MMRIFRLFVVVAILLATRSAAAQVGGGGGVGGMGGGGGTSGPSSGFPGAAEQGPEGGPPPRESPRSVKLFDSSRTTQSFQLDLGQVWYRPALGGRQSFERGTGELLLGIAVTTKWGPFFLSGLQQTDLRAFGAGRLAWSILTHQFAAGVFLGPFEPEVRIGASLLTVDAFDGHWSAEMLTPRVGAGVGIHLGKIRLDIETHSEYLWRWFGPDYLIRGVSLGLRLDVPRPKGPVFSDSPPR